MLAADVITLVVQVNGKLRDRIEVPADAGEEEVLELARASEKVGDSHRRARDRQGDRRPRQARQSRRPMTSGHRSSPSRGRTGIVRGSARNPLMLVRRLSDAAVQDFHRLRSHILMDAGELGSRHMTVTWIEVPPDTEQELHSHEEAEQVYVVVGGVGELSATGDTERLEPGDLALIPPASDHVIANRGTGDAGPRLGAVARRLGRGDDRPPVGRDRRLRRGLRHVLIP